MKDQQQRYEQMVKGRVQALVARCFKKALSEAWASSVQWLKAHAVSYSKHWLVVKHKM